MTKRQRNHKVKTYYEKYFKNKRIKDEHSIQFINNPSKEVQLEAVKHDAYYLKYINNP